MTPRRPLIGITTYARNDANHFTLPAEYVEAVTAAGGLPVLVAPTDVPPRQWLERLDAVILAGGADLDPATYGGASHETVYGVDSERDRAELALARSVVESRRPALCICRGTQLLAVALGGTLVPHLPDLVGEDVKHRLPPREPTEHEILLKEDSRLAAILGARRFRAASWHHQALERVPRELDVVGHAPDGVIEAVEMPAHPWLFGVQWHPELTFSKDASQHRLFAALVSAAARTQGG